MMREPSSPDGAHSVVLDGLDAEVRPFGSRVDATSTRRLVTAHESSALSTRVSRFHVVDDMSAPRKNWPATS